MALTVDSESVRAHLTLVQGAISRMSSNSSSCKTWCLTIVSAILVLAIDKNKPQALWLGFIPVGLFLLLDAYYLSLEYDFRDIYNDFVQELKKDNNESEIKRLLYDLTPRSGLLHRIWDLILSIFSFSVFFFYAALALALYITQKYV